MKRNVVATTMASALAMMWSSAAAAQTTGDAAAAGASTVVQPRSRPAATNGNGTAQTPAAPEQELSAEEAGRLAQTGDDGEEILVTGLRLSLATAQDIKRNSDSILDAIVAQDIGKLPDDTAAESLARVTGVQVTRTRDEVTGVLVRGLPNVTTSYNGREIFTADARRVDLQDFPAQALAGIEVYKSGTANLIEGGLAGIVNVRTRRPFDFKGGVFAGGARGTYNDQSKQFDPSGNLLFSKRWDTGIGEIGLLANITYVQSQYYNGVRFVDRNPGLISSNNVVSPASLGKNLIMPNRVGIFNESGKRYRPSGNFSLQWAPSSNSEIYLEGIYQGARIRNSTDQLTFDMRGGDQTLTELKLVPGTTNQVASGLRESGWVDGGWRSSGDDTTDTYQIATGGKWESDNVTLSTDFAYSNSKRESRGYSLDFYFPVSQTVSFDFMNREGVEFDIVNTNAPLRCPWLGTCRPGWDRDVLNQNNYLFQGYYERLNTAKGDGLQWRGDIVLKTNSDFLHTLQFGNRITDRNASYGNGNRYAYVADLFLSLTDLPIGDLVLTRDPYRGKVQGLTQYWAPGVSSVLNNRPELRQKSYELLQQLSALNPNDRGYAEAVQQWSTEQIQLDPYNVFEGHERSYAAYAQGKYGFDLGSIEIDGVAGIRLVNTIGRFSSFSRIRNPAGVQEVTPAVARQNQLDVLPNFSMRVMFDPKLQLRLGYTFTRTRPDFWQLNPQVNIQPVQRPPNFVPNPNNPNDLIVATGSVGNPQLKALTSKNYDASLEYYFSKSGMISGAVFYRDLFGFLSNFNRFYTDPVFGYMNVSQPLNSGEGYISGAEVNFQTFLDFLPERLRGFGISANATYLVGKNRQPRYDSVTDTFTYGEYAKIGGLSKYTVNAAFFYERNGLAARISYNRRDDWVNGYTQLDTGESFAGNITRAVDRLDMSINYDIVKQLTVSFDMSNMLAKPFRTVTYFTPEQFYPNDVRYEGRYYGLGIRFRFGE